MIKNPLNHGSLFTGIDGFGYAAEIIGWNNLLTCEINPFLHELLKIKYPNATHYRDITSTDFSFWRNRIDVLTGGFPCQPYSTAGKRKGTDDERHLWPQMLRAIREIQPPWVVGEKVRGIINWNGGLVFDEVQTDLETSGYEVQPFLLPASSTNAPHERYRVWFVAYSNEFRNNRNTSNSNIQKENKEKRSFVLEQIMRSSDIGTITNTDSFRQYKKFIENKEYSNKTGIKAFSQFEQSDYDVFITNPNCAGFEKHEFTKKSNTKKIASRLDIKQSGNWENFPTQSPICTGNDGISSELLRSFIIDNSEGILTEKEINKIISQTLETTRKETIKAGGNAVVPQVVLQIYRAINDY